MEKYAIASRRDALGDRLDAVEPAPAARG